MDRAGPEAKAWLKKIFPEIQPEELKKMGGPQQATLDAQLEASREVLAGGADVFSIDRDLPCDACKAFSEFSPLRVDSCTIDSKAYSPGDGSITILMGGFTCKDWSQRGVGMGCGGQSFAPFLVMVYEIRSRKPGLGLLECTEYQPDSLVVALLGDLYLIDSVVLSPLHFGVPVKRNRKWPP